MATSVVVLVVVAWLLLAGSGGPPPPRQPLRLSVIRFHRIDLLAGGPLSVRVRSARGGRITISARLQAAGAQTPPGGGVQSVELPRRAARVVALPLGAAVSVLGGCRPARVVVTARDGSGAGPASVAAQVPLEPPDCARFFGPRSVWTTPLAADAPLDPRSRSITTTLRGQVERAFRSGPPPTINTDAYAPPVYTVPVMQPKLPVILDRPPGYDPGLAAAFAAVPLPASAAPSAGADSELVVWQPATDTLWEFWRFRRAPDGLHASWGGRLDHVTTGPGHFASPHANWGTSASSLPLVGGLILPHELESGHIDHALSIGLPLARARQFALPAQRTDGRSRCLDSIPEGARFRLDPQLDIGRLRLPRATGILARAAQRYGLLVRDQAAVPVLYAQNPLSLGGDPYPALLRGNSPSDLLARFPWQRLQLVKMRLAEAAGPNAPKPAIRGGRGLVRCGPRR